MRLRTQPIVRQLDHRGRIHLSPDLLRRLNISPNTELEVLYEDRLKQIILLPPRFACDVCGSEDAAFSYRGTRFCEECYDGIRSGKVDPIL